MTMIKRFKRIELSGHFLFVLGLGVFLSLSACQTASQGTAVAIKPVTTSSATQPEGATDSHRMSVAADSELSNAPKATTSGAQVAPEPPVEAEEAQPIEFVEVTPKAPAPEILEEEVVASREGQLVNDRSNWPELKLKRLHKIPEKQWALDAYFRTPEDPNPWPQKAQHAGNPTNSLKYAEPEMYGKKNLRYAILEPFRVAAEMAFMPLVASKRSARDFAELPKRAPTIREKRNNGARRIHGPHLH